MSIEARNIFKRFGRFTALDNVTLHAPTGELVALLGPSGSGKTTLLRVIAGLEQPDADSGPILFHDEDVAGRPIGERQVGFVFQHYALFRQMTVFENIAFGLRVRRRAQRPAKSEIRERVQRLLRLIQLESAADRYPAQLSGGQRQRVALARALAVEPKVLLLDEPFGALDARVRQELRRWLRRLHDEIHVTSVFVTHDQEEALEVADRVVVMNQGRIEQVGTAEEVFHNPANEFVMNFLGNVNVFERRVAAGQPFHEMIEFQCADELPAGLHPAKVFVRPHDLDVDIRRGDGYSLEGRVRQINAAGPEAKLEIQTESGEWLHVIVGHERFRHLGLQVGHTVFVRPRQVRVFLEPGGVT